LPEVLERAPKTGLVADPPVELDGAFREFQRSRRIWLAAYERHEKLRGQRPLELIEVPQREPEPSCPFMISTRTPEQPEPGDDLGPYGEGVVRVKRPLHRAADIVERAFDEREPVALLSRADRLLGFSGERQRVTRVRAARSRQFARAAETLQSVLAHRLGQTVPRLVVDARVQHDERFRNERREQCDGVARELQCRAKGGAR
jgi:hypothetical protein